MRVLVTGSGGLVGSACVERFIRDGHDVQGTDTNMRARWFGPAGSVDGNVTRLMTAFPGYRHHQLDIRNAVGMNALFSTPPDLVIHCAAQPSHDMAREMPLEDFNINAGGTMVLLEALRRTGPGTTFVFMSTNKVYGDNPNRLTLTERETRWDAPDVDERMSTDGCLHSVFGASKLAADTMVQEYGRTYGLRTVCLRAGCLTGPAHAGVELHGFLSYLAKCAVHGRPYTVHGYGGKQVRDNLDARDLADLIARIAADPPSPGDGPVYNVGGGRGNSVSIMEAVQFLADMGHPMVTTYSPEARLGDHICYISDLTKVQARYPGWGPVRDVPRILADIVAAEREVTRCQK